MGALWLRGFGEGLDNRCVQSVVVNVLYYSHPVAILINSLARTDCIFRDTKILLDLIFFFSVNGEESTTSSAEFWVFSSSLLIVLPY